MTSPTPNEQPPATVDILAVPVHRVTMQQALALIVSFITHGRETGATHQVATVNVDFVTNAVSDPRLAQLLRHVDLSVADGMPIVWGSRLLGAAAPERIAGVDLIPQLAERCAANGFRMYLFGSRTGIAERAADLLRQANPALDVVGDSGPIMADVGDISDDDLARISAHRPDVVCVALGNPKQEWWIDRHRTTIGAPVFIGVGGTFDLLVGEKRRAPAWVGRIGMEWIYRTLQEPGRLGRRYARDIVVFMPRLALQVVRTRFGRRAP